MPIIDEILFAGEDMLIHASFRTLRDYGGFSSPGIFCQALTEKAAPTQTIVMPAFTYSFVNRNKATVPYDRENSRSVTGAVSEAFRNLSGVFRTSSPSHSFTIWGGASGVKESNNPVSPLGQGSVPDILYKKGKLRIALVGCGFESLTMLHYFESLLQIPYLTTNCWNYMGVEPLTVSVGGTYPAIEVPGCSKGFRNFEDHLTGSGKLKSLAADFSLYLIDPYMLMQEFRDFTDNDPLALLCGKGCLCCDSRRVRESQKLFKRRN